MVRLPCILAVLLAASCGPALAGALAIVAHPTVTVDTLRAEELSHVFLGKLPKLGNVVVNPVNKEASNPDRIAFDRIVHRMDEAAMRDYWLAARIKGEGHPPRSFQTDAAVIRYVSAVPGAVGYVAYPPAASGLRCLAINGVAPTPQTIESGTYLLRMK